MAEHFLLTQAGREACTLDGSIDECRAQLRELSKWELGRARRLSKQATRHRISADTYLITLGRDRRSSLWTTIGIIRT